MTEKARALPPWMVARKEKEEKKEKKDKEQLRSKRKRKTARAAFYCMTEKELVEAAVSFLTNNEHEDAALLTDRKVEEKAAKTTVKRRHIPSKTTAEPLTEVSEEQCLNSDEDQDMTYVSGSDLDITEVETVPYTSSPQHQGSEGQGPTVQGHGSLMDDGLKKEGDEKPPHAPEEEEKKDDDSFRLVREIFFS